MLAVFLPARCPSARPNVSDLIGAFGCRLFANDVQWRAVIKTCIVITMVMFPGEQRSTDRADSVATVHRAMSVIAV